MANYISSLQLDWQTKGKGVFSETEMRAKHSQLLVSFMRNPDTVIDNWKNLKTSDSRPGKFHILKRSKVALGTSRLASHSGAYGDSIEKTPSWKTYTRTFKMSMKAGDRNLFNNPERFNNEMKNSILDIHEAIDTDLNTYLSLQKTQVAKSPVGKAVWNGTDYVYEIALAEKEYFYQVVKSVMRANGHKGDLEIIADSIARMEGERAFKNGKSNANNTAWQDSGLAIFEDHNFIDTNFNGVLYAIPNGAVAALPWIPKVNRAGEGDENGVTGVFTSFADPLGTGLQFALHYKKGLADTQASGGEAQDIVTEFEVSIDMAYETAPLSVANETAIVKFGQKTT